MSHDWPAALRRPLQGNPSGPGQPRAQGLQHPPGGAAGHRRSLPLRLSGPDGLLHLSGGVISHDCEGASRQEEWGESWVLVDLIC